MVCSCTTKTASPAVNHRNTIIKHLGLSLVLLRLWEVLSVLCYLQTRFTSWAYQEVSWGRGVWKSTRNNAVTPTYISHDLHDHWRQIFQCEKLSAIRNSCSPLLTHLWVQSLIQHLPLTCWQSLSLKHSGCSALRQSNEAAGHLASPGPGGVRENELMIILLTYKVNYNITMSKMICITHD